MEKINYLYIFLKRLIARHASYAPPVVPLFTAVKTQPNASSTGPINVTATNSEAFRKLLLFASALLNSSNGYAVIHHALTKS